jgi:hypothetical protein
VVPPEQSAVAARGEVPAIDLARHLLTTTTAADFVVVKMDIGGGEWALIPHLNSGRARCEPPVHSFHCTRQFSTSNSVGASHLSATFSSVAVQFATIAACFSNLNPLKRDHLMRRFFHLHSISNRFISLQGRTLYNGCQTNEAFPKRRSALAR